MATSLHACFPSSCKNQHQMKTLTKSPNVVRRSSSTRQNTANRRSAVERLEESKANYVKSERVLDTKQEFKNSSHLRVTTAPQLDILYKAPAKFPLDNPKLISSCDEVKLSYLKVQHPPCLQVPKSPPAVRTRAKSHSEFRDAQLTRKHSFASQGRRHRIEVLIDIESQLKQLITTGSRENVSAMNDPTILNHMKMPEVMPKVRRGYSDPIRKSCWMPPDLSPDANFIHKSMPDLTPSPQKPCRSLSSGESSAKTEERISCVPPKRKPCPSLSSGESNNAKSEERISYVVPTRKPNLNITQLEKDEDAFDPMFREPRRFSNGTGMLHLTPYYSASSQLQRKPVSRSKSDVSHRYSKRSSEYFPRRSNYTTAEIERFFDTMGLDTNAWHHVTSPSSVSSPPCFFESISSIDSNDDRNSECSDESIPGVPKEGLRNHDLRVHGPLETSIVEKNARVIKWLYNCRKSAYDS